MPSCCSQQQDAQNKDEENQAGDEDDDDQPFTRKPFTRTMQKQERDALQKWVQCAKCAKWRKVCSVEQLFWDCTQLWSLTCWAASNLLNKPFDVSSCKQTLNLQGYNSTWLKEAYRLAFTASLLQLHSTPGTLHCTVEDWLLSS